MPRGGINSARLSSKMHPAGIEPALPESESGVLSVRLRLPVPFLCYQKQLNHNNRKRKKFQVIQKNLRKKFVTGRTARTNLHRKHKTLFPEYIFKDTRKEPVTVMAIGYLLMEARTAHDAVPLSGIQIRILSLSGNTVYTLTTDENGEAGPVPLETLDKSFSQNPYFTGTPYYSYNVLAQASGFHPLYITDIPIFEGETAVLPLAPVPADALDRNPRATEITIGKPAVAMQEPRNQEGAAQSTYVLRQVAIPNPITVHLGTPSQNAGNVQVSFPDYVKNVASSEKIGRAHV